MSQLAEAGSDTVPGAFPAAPAQDRPRWLLPAEILTVLILAAAGLWAVRPLLEEWGLFQAYNAAGLSYQARIFSLISMRPLHLTPSALQWLAGGGQPWGVGIVAALMVAARYAVSRWAVSPVLPPVQRWIFATACTVLVGWPALWLARFHPAQLSATFFLVVLGMGIRLCLRPSGLATVIGALCLCASLMAYQALALLVLVLPVLALLWTPPGGTPGRSARLRQGARCAVMVAGGLALYGVYAAIIFFATDGAYEVTMAASATRTSPVALLMTNIPIAYQATFGRSPESLGLIGALLAAALAGWDGRRGALYALLALLAVACLPLLSLVYVSPLNLRDPERAMFPVACGAVVILLGVLLLREARPGKAVGPQGRAGAVLLVGALLAAGTMPAATARARWELQKDVTTQVTDLVLATGARHVLVRDETGLLGDVYTLLGDTLWVAVTNRGVAARIDLCTPEGVDRLHPDSRRYPIPTTPRCAAPPPDVLEATARLIGERVVIERGASAPR